jgi:hypothetical protein
MMTDDTNILAAELEALALRRLALSLYRAWLQSRALEIEDRAAVIECLVMLVKYYQEQERQALGLFRLH